MLKFFHGLLFLKFCWHIIRLSPNLHVLSHAANLYEAEAPVFSVATCSLACTSLLDHDTMGSQKIGTCYIPTAFQKIGISVKSSRDVRYTLLSLGLLPLFVYFILLPSLASSPGSSQFFNVTHRKMGEPGI